jgi:hypothetical protein
VFTREPHSCSCHLNKKNGKIQITPLSYRQYLHNPLESSLVGFGGLDDNPIKGLTSVLSVEQVLNAKLTGFNTSEKV